MAISHCNWDYCTDKIPRGLRRCPEHRDMEWWEEYQEHVKHLCWEREEIPLDDFEDALDIIEECRESGGPSEAKDRLEEEHGIDPIIFLPNLNGTTVMY